MTCSPPTVTFPALTYCGIGNINLNPLAAGPDLNFTATNGVTIAMRLCGAVSNTQCVNNFGNNVQICQSGSYVIAELNAPSGQTSFAYTNGVDATAGVNFTINNGGACNINGNIYNRQAIGVITCGATNSITSFFESSTPCIYDFTVTSPLVCVQQFAFCQISYSTNIEQTGYQNLLAGMDFCCLWNTDCNKSRKFLVDWSDHGNTQCVECGRNWSCCVVSENHRTRARRLVSRQLLQLDLIHARRIKRLHSSHRVSPSIFLPFKLTALATVSEIKSYSPARHTRARQDHKRQTRTTLSHSCR